MIQRTLVRKKYIIILIVVALAVVGSLVGYRLSRPFSVTVSLSHLAPLSARATIHSREEVQISLRIEGMNDDDIVVSFEPYQHEHDIPILGLYADRNNTVVITATTQDGQQHERTVNIRTDRLPEIYPVFVMNRFIEHAIAPGMTFLHLGHYDHEMSFTPLPTVVDAFGNVRWYYTEDIGHVMKQLDNGNLLIQEGNTLKEIDMLGNHVATRAVVPSGIHHDVAFMDNGNLLVLSTAPGSFEDGVVEVDGDSGALLRGWDFRLILDPERPPQPRNLEVADWLHLNGIDYSPHDDSFIVSGRDQSAVVKVDADTGTPTWILGNHAHWEYPLNEKLLHPVGTEFSWQWGQHAPMVNPDNPYRVLIYDNGNERSYTEPVDPKENYSRAVEFEIDEHLMEVRQVWEYGRELGSETFTPFIGDANYLENGNRLISFGGITRDLTGEPVKLFDFDNSRLNDMKISARIVEVTGESPAQEVLRITIEDSDPDSFVGYRCYQAERYPLYHPALLR